MKIHYIIFLCFLFFLSSCYDKNALDTQKPNDWQPEVSVPLGFINLGKRFETFIKDYDLPGVVPDTVDVLWNDTLYLIAKNDLNVGDLLPFSLTTFSEDVENNIDYVTLTINIINGFPTTMKFNIGMYDSSSVLLSTLVDNEFPPGTIENDRVIANNEIEPIRVTYKDDDLQSILSVANIKIETEMIITTEMLKKIKLYSGYTLQVQIGVTVGFNIDLSTK